MRRDWEVQRGPSGPLSGRGSFARRRGWGSFGPAGHLSAEITVLMPEVDGKYSFLPASISSRRYEGKEALYVLSLRRFCWICEKGHTTLLITRLVSHPALLSLFNPPLSVMFNLTVLPLELVNSPHPPTRPHPTWNTLPTVWSEIAHLVAKIMGLTVVASRHHIWIEVAALEAMTVISAGGYHCCCYIPAFRAFLTYSTSLKCLLLNHTGPWSQAYAIDNHRRRMDYCEQSEHLLCYGCGKEDSPATERHGKGNMLVGNRIWQLVFSELWQSEILHSARPSHRVS